MVFIPVKVNSIDIIFILSHNLLNQNKVTAFLSCFLFQSFKFSHASKGMLNVFMKSTSDK